MRIQVKFNNDDKFGLNKKWVRTLLLVIALLFSTSSLIHIVFEIFKPKGYETILSIFAGNPIEGLLFGAAAITCYFLVKNSKPV